MLILTFYKLSYDNSFYPISSKSLQKSIFKQELIDNAFELGWVSNFENSLNGFLYFETDEESDNWFNKQELI